MKSIIQMFPWDKQPKTILNPDYQRIIIVPLPNCLEEDHEWLATVYNLLLVWGNEFISLQFSTQTCCSLWSIKTDFWAWRRNLSSLQGYAVNARKKSSQCWNTWYHTLNDLWEYSNSLLTSGCQHSTSPNCLREVDDGLIHFPILFIWK